MSSATPDILGAITERLGRCGQEHLLRFVPGLSPTERTELLTEIEALDLPYIKNLIQKYVLKDQKIELPQEILPPTIYPAKPGLEQRDRYEEAQRYGEQVISENKVAAFTVAGGQGTRLNYDGPKGNVPATPVRGKTLFEVFAESIRATQRRYDCKVPWYIMTSPSNHTQTVQIFEEHNYFGLETSDVWHFPQGVMPSFDVEGKILLSAPHRLALSPDGHGGSLRALYNKGALKDMASRQVEYISYFQVDNPLVYVIDPLFIGLHALEGAEMSSKAVRKIAATEKVGNFSLANGRVMVIEYSDLPDELAQKRHTDGRLVFEFGSIAIHVISRRFVERLNQSGFSLPWHRAKKIVPYVDDHGKLIQPTEPNAIKLETFVFDALSLADKSITLEVERWEQFAPIKNATGMDSLESSRQLQVERAARWLEGAGVQIPRQPGGGVDATIEISPRFALTEAEVIERRSEIDLVKPGDAVYLD